VTQFIVRAYRTPHGYRVVVDGMTHFDVEEESEIDPRAQAVILERLRAFLPPRARPPTEPGTVAVRCYDLQLVPVDAPPPSTSASEGEKESAEAQPRASPTPATPVNGRRLRRPRGDSGLGRRRE